MRKQFNLDYYLEHPDVKVVTRKGRSVRIICTDVIAEDKPNVVGLVYFDNYEEPFRYDSDGRLYGDEEDSLDIFFDLPDPEKKRVPLTYEDLLERVKAGKTMWVTDNDGVALQIVEFGDSGWFATGSYNEHKNTLLMEQGMYFADGTPCWKEVEE